MKLSAIVPNVVGILPSITGQYWFADEKHVICEAYTKGEDNLLPTNRAWTDGKTTVPLFIHENDACKFVLKEND